ncbi:DUF1553 domain-containing protein [Algoriphagus chordae]|uniref:Concanavalin A-like lectin/glucanase superfamily protein n=1 Tax=Algoriphagus chordae TaxID=237019 RepID=A0A2W7RK37_9BACT|nr:DUF1553 domain-containing protein [Algoriphagus chordae]PZX51025.1 concanavalin A-like lectin/glucanase superfamily protein [Algoriphagus chordae]
MTKTQSSMIKKQIYHFFSCLLMLLALISCSPDLPEEIAIAYDDLPEQLDFNIHVKPILSDKCFACHGPDKGKIEAGLQLHSAETAYQELPESPGYFAITPKNLKNSEMFHRIMSEDAGEIMPPPESNLTLSSREKAILVRWIEEGAEYKPHWAFVKPEPQKLPKVSDKKWPKNEIDFFVLNRLDQEGLKPSPPADKELMLRRLFLDLTGMPPTPEDVKAYLSDQSSDAYERQVDKLLASPHYGEKMATDWMDVARFADTHGYQVDDYRDMSPWRDWVIRSFNENLTYRDFITFQLAGDLLPNPTQDQILATGFNRLNSQNSEDGIVPEEYRVEGVIDRTSVVGQGIMALTAGCARCHDHKYDPISHKEFYQLYSFFNQVNESGQISRDPMDIPVPTLMLPTEEQKKILDYLKKEVTQKETAVENLEEDSQISAEKWVESGAYQSLKIPKADQGLAAHFSFDGNLTNRKSGESGKMDLMYANPDRPKFVKGKNSQALHLDGDAWVDLKPVGIYKRNEPFSIGLWINVPDSLKEGVIFHKNMGTALHAYKGYHLYYRDKKLEVMLAHTWPENAIEKISLESLPTDSWNYVTLTYDGSSKASGVKLFLNGEEMKMQVKHDNLYKDIIFKNYEDVIYPKPIEPGLSIGGRWRGFGLKGGKVDELRVYDRQLLGLEVKALADPLTVEGILSKSPDKMTSEERTLLKEYHIARDKSYSEALVAVAKARAAYVDSIENVKEVMVMKDMPESRSTYILLRGLYENYGEEVFPNTPSEILPMAEELPKNRLGLAEWFFDPNHPLTARVAVNRYWQNYFGKGIVRTSEDFGNQGELPSHPELFDWLALEFMNSGWDVKALQKKIVMSATYQQSSFTSPEMRDFDPDNILLARGPKNRLSSEMIRDNALVASELLVDKVGGESVKTYQPEGLWSMNSTVYVPDVGEKLYRRSMYTFWKKTIPNPTQATFDQPERNECTVRRQKTNTPLQSLVLLNDPTYVEACRKIGEIMTLSGDKEKAIKDAFLRLSGRFPSENELAILEKVQEEEYEAFRSNKTRAKGWLESGQYRIDDSLDGSMVAANAVVASTILNSDAVITKR